MSVLVVGGWCVEKMSQHQKIASEFYTSIHQNFFAELRPLVRDDLCVSMPLHMEQL